MKGKQLVGSFAKTRSEGEANELRLRRPRVDWQGNGGKGMRMKGKQLVGSFAKTRDEGSAAAPFWAGVGSRMGARE